MEGTTKWMVYHGKSMKILLKMEWETSNLGSKFIW